MYVMDSWICEGCISLECYWYVVDNVAVVAVVDVVVVRVSHEMGSFGCRATSALDGAGSGCEKTRRQEKERMSLRSMCPG